MVYYYKKGRETLLGSVAQPDFSTNHWYQSTLPRLGFICIIRIEVESSNRTRQLSNSTLLSLFLFFFFNQQTREQEDNLETAGRCFKAAYSVPLAHVLTMFHPRHQLYAFVSIPTVNQTLQSTQAASEVESGRKPKRPFEAVPAVNLKNYSLTQQSQKQVPTRKLYRPNMTTAQLPLWFRGEKNQDGKQRQMGGEGAKGVQFVESYGTLAINYTRARMSSPDAVMLTLRLLRLYQENPKAVVGLKYAQAPGLMRKPVACSALQIAEAVMSRPIPQPASCNNLPTHHWESTANAAVATTEAAIQTLAQAAAARGARLRDLFEKMGQYDAKGTMDHTGGATTKLK